MLLTLLNVERVAGADIIFYLLAVNFLQFPLCGFHTSTRCVAIIMIRHLYRSNRGTSVVVLFVLCLGVEFCAF